MNTYNNPIQTAIDHFLNNSLKEVFSDHFTNGQPAVNIYEDKESHFLELAIPGVSKEDIKLSIENNRLIIKADKKTENSDQKEDSYIRQEFDYRSFSRSFAIPDTADISKIDAKYDAGILEIKLSKKEEAVDNGPIDIKIS